MSSNPILIFDMDDTLYDELSFARSGLAHVAQSIHSSVGVRLGDLKQAFEEALSDGRSRVFDRAFARLEIGNRRLVRACVTVYRRHSPAIELYPAARRCLERFGDYRKFLVTDGNTTAQAGKVRALGLSDHMEKVFLTYRYGRKHAKPSPFCFERIQAITGVPRAHIVYVGDDPRKDFKGIRPLGYRTVRVLTGQHAARRAPPAEDAEIAIPDLDALTPAFLARLTGDGSGGAENER
jgi:putative hydrolase of the HAD superfamily